LDHTADVRRHHGDVAPGKARLDIRRHHRCAIEVVRRYIEEALDLPGVEIHGKHAVGAGGDDQIGDQLGRDRRPRPGLPVLPGIAEIRDHGGDPLRRGAVQRVDADQQLHEVVVGRVARRLHHEHVLAAHILEDFDEDLLVGEAAHACLGDRQLEVSGDVLHQRKVRIAGQKLHGSVLGWGVRAAGPLASALL
jgi:hypothetical protein